MLARGKVRGKKAERMRAVMASLTSNYYDPPGTLRHRGANRTKDQFHFKPDQPSLCRYGHPHIITFKSALDVDSTNRWDESSAGTGDVLAVQDERGGIAKFTNGAADNNYYYYFRKYEVARLQANKDLWFRAFFKVGDVSQADMFIGLCAKLASGDVFDNRVDSIGFYLTDGSASLLAEARKNGTATPSTALATLSDNDLISVGFHVVSTSMVILHVDKDYKAIIKTNLPDDTELAFAFGCRNGEASANSMSIGRTIIFADE